MVQVFSPSPRAMQAGQIGQALGLGISKRMGLAEAQREASNAGGDPVKLAFSLAKASMAAPGMERSLGQIYEQLLARTESKGYTKGLGGEATPETVSGLAPTGFDRNPISEGEVSQDGTINPSMDVPLEGSPNNFKQPNETTSNISLPTRKNYSPEQVQSVAHQYLLDMRPDLIEGTSAYGRVPTFNYQSKSTLRPEEEAQIRQKLDSQGLAPKVQDRVVDTVRNDIQARYNESLKNFGLDTVRQKEINDKWDTFRKLSDKNLDPIIGKYQPGYLYGGKPRTANDLRNKYFQYAGDLPVDLTPEQMHAQAGTMLQNDINNIDALGAIPEMPFIRDPNDVEKNVKDHKEAYKDLYDRGFYESLKEDAVDKGMGLEELHWTLFGDQTDKKNLRSVSDLSAPKLYFKDETKFTGPGAPPKIERINNPNYPKEREIYVNNLSKRLKTIREKDDLILLRSQALNSGAQEADFNDALSKAQDEGLVLSPFQRTQMQEVRIPRKRPQWEIFNPSAWKQWINHAAGKR